jgi:SAM-dependent methyltransferase
VAEDWSGDKGRFWAENADWFSRMLGDFLPPLVEGAGLLPGERVVDIGCGCGDLSIAAGAAVGPSGSVVGVDLSADELAVAAQRAAAAGLDHVGFELGDATTIELAPPFDVLVSRFGVMFFDDPVRAFANLRRAGTDGAALRCVAWRSAAENPFMTTAERAAAPVLPNLPPRRPDGPGQFAFADDRRVRDILDESGWTAVDIRPLDVECSLSEPDLVAYLTRLGPVGLALQEADERTRALVVDAVRPAFDPYLHGADVRFTAACWMIAARAGRP